MRYLGIDYGTKRIGVAISDEEGKLAFPKEIVPNNSEALTRVGKILADENIRQVVVGDSVDFKGEPNAIMTEAGEFIKKLEERFKVKVHREKEFLTSVEARRYGDEGNRGEGRGKSNAVDASAAALILQRFLDRENKQHDNTR